MKKIRLYVSLGALAAAAGCASAPQQARYQTSNYNQPAAAVVAKRSSRVANSNASAAKPRRRGRQHNGTYIYGVSGAGQTTF